MVRNVVSVIAGYLVWTAIFLGGGAAIRGVRPQVHDENGMTRDVTTLAVYLAFSVAASFAAGYLTAKLASSSRLRMAVVLAICLLATGIPVQMSAWNDLPVWYNIAFLILLAPITIVGAMAAGARNLPPAVQTDS